MKKVVSTLASSVCIAAFQPSDAFTQQPQFCNKAGCRRGRRCKVVGETVGLADTDGATLLDYGDRSLLEVPALDIDANYNNPATQPMDRRPHEQVSDILYFTSERKYHMLFKTHINMALL